MVRSLLILNLIALGLSAQSFNAVKVIPKQNGSATGTVDYFELYQNGANYVGFQAPTNVVTSYRMTLPAALPTAAGMCPVFSTTGQMTFEACETTAITSNYNWSQSPSDNLSVPGSKTITLSPCPQSVNGAQTNYVVYISGGVGTAEVVPVTGGSGAYPSSSCTLIVTTANAHTGAYTVGSASAGIQEAIYSVPDFYPVAITVPANVNGHPVYSDIKTESRKLAMQCVANAALIPQLNNINILNVASTNAATVRGCNFQNSLSKTGITGILFYNPSGSNSFGKITDNVFYGTENGIHSQTHNSIDISDNLILETTNAAIWLENAAGPDSGAGIITNNTLSSSVSGTYGFLWNAPGAIVYTNNLHNGFVEQIRLAPSGVTSQVVISGNVLDGGTATTHGIRWTGSTAVFGIRIQDNYMVAYGFGPTSAIGISMEGSGATDVIISSNQLSAAPGLGTTKGIVVTTGSNFFISENKINGYDTGMDIDSSASDILISSPMCRSNMTACITNDSTTTQIVTNNPFTYAQLPTIVANGSSIYCSNCSSTCAVAGTGAVATRLNGAWECSSGGGGGGATSISGLTDLKVTKTNSTVLNIATGYGSIGSVPTNYAAATGTISGTVTSGTAYIYLDTSAVLTIGHNTATTITCSGCTTATSISAFPVGSKPIATATWASNIWDTSGITDLRALSSNQVLTPGTGVSFTYNADGSITITNTGNSAVSPALFQMYGTLGTNSGGNETSVFTANQTRWTRFTLPYRATFTGMGIGANLAIGGGKGLRFAVADTGGTILHKSTVNTTCAANAICAAAFSSPITLDPGVYYVGITTDSTTFRALQANNIASINSPTCLATEAGSPAVSGTGTVGSGTGASVDFGASMGSITSWSCDNGSNTFTTGYMDVFFYN